MCTPHTPSLDVYLLGYDGTLIYSLSRVRVIVPGVGVRDVVAPQWVSTNPPTRTLHAYSRVDDARADVGR